MRKNKSIIFILLIAIQIQTISFSIDMDNILIEKTEIDIDEKIFRIKTSGSWFFNGTGIYIDDNNPNYNWSKTAAENDWCFGFGTEIYPYIIENVTIDVNYLGSCIQIIDSSTYFIIRNCTLYNSGSGTDDAGIYLGNTDYGIIANNSITSNYNGIHLRFSHNNSIIKNKISLNTHNGMYVSSSSDNSIYNNSLNYNNNGFFFRGYSQSNNCSFNKIYNNNGKGIQLNTEFGGKNIYFNNTISNNLGDGIYMIDREEKNSIIENLISNNGGNGITIEYDQHSCVENLIKRNIINNNYYGIDLYRSHTNEILQNNFSNNFYGMRIRQSNGNLIGNNTLKDSLVAFYHADNYYTNYTGNLLFNCGILIQPSHDHDITTKIDNTNFVNEKPIFYYFNKSNLNSENFSNAGQVILLDCNDSFVSDLEFNSVTAGVQLMDCVNITISDNNFSSNKIWAIFLRNSDENIIKGNLIKNTKGDAPNIAGNEGGIFLYYDCDNNVISGNLIYNNSINGIYVGAGSGNNLFYLNNFTENLLQVRNFQSNNQWDNGSIGNYWDDYIGEDTNDDGRGDSPYNIYEYGQDNYPIYWDVPHFLITSPTLNRIYGNNAPDYELSVDEGIADTIWYRLNSGIPSFTSNSIGIINQTAWENLDNGTVFIEFYINDSRGYMAPIQNVWIRKDNISPIITIISPNLNQTFTTTIPTITVQVDERNLDSMMYSVNGHDNVTFWFSDTINQSVWDSLPDGEISIKIYAIDLAGNIGYQEIIIIKQTPSSNPSSVISGYSFIFIFCLLTIGILSISKIVLKKYRLSLTKND